VLAVTPAYAGLEADETLDHLPVAVRQAFMRCMRERRDHHGESWYACYYRTRDGNESLLYMAFSDPIGAEERELLALFSANVASTYEKLVQREECAATQQALIALLAQAAGLAPAIVRQLRLAAPLHDLGHSGVPDAIMHKPGALDDDEWRLMRRHCETGHAMLARARQPVLQLAAVIAHEHHERWDGGGYPRGLAGERIHIAGRIAALADCIDVMVSTRSYRPAWPLPQVLEQVRSESGRHFDPALAALLANTDMMDALSALYARLPPT
jgi:response regulator RpfG family c-di-GMP phosphodiesterase